MIETIGMSISDAPNIRPAFWSIFFALDGAGQPVSLLDAATIIANIQASPYLNNGWELTGSAKGYALYVNGTTAIVLARAYHYFDVFYINPAFLADNPNYAILESFENGLTGWGIGDLGSGGATVIAETIDDLGTASFLVPGKNPVAFPYIAYTLAGTIDLSAVDDIVLPVYLPGLPAGAIDAPTPNYYPNLTAAAISFAITADTTLINYKMASLNAANTHRKLTWGWNYISLKLSDFATTSGTPNLSAIKKIYVRVQGSVTPGVDYKMNFGELITANEKKTAIVCFSFDDGLSTPWVETLAWQALNPSAPSIPITLYVIPELIGTAGYLTLAQCQAAYNAGCDISVHGEYRYDQYVSAAALETALETDIAWLNGNGFTRGIQHCAYPFGAYGVGADATLSHTQIKTAFSSVGIKTARTILPNASGSYSPVNASANRIINGIGIERPHRLFGAAMMNTGLITTPGNIDNIKSYIDHVKSYGGIIHLWSHHIATSGATGYITPTEWQAVLDYAYQGQVDGDLHILPASTAYKVAETIK